jgi:glycogen debranching enzyme
MNPGKANFTYLICFLLLACGNPDAESGDSFKDLLANAPAISGKEAYLNSPYVTAGDRLYMVGHQDGGFPELGWHIKGEMGGVWNHPIKLMDGFNAFLTIEGSHIPLQNARRFTNYPMAGRHDYRLDSLSLEVERWQFVPDGKEGLVLEYVLHNTGKTDKSLEFGFAGHADLRPTWLGERTGMSDGKDHATYEGDLEAWVVRDSLNPWFVAYGSNLPVSSHSKRNSTYAGNGISSELTYSVEIPAGKRESIRFAVAGSYTSEAKARETYSEILEKAGPLLASKRDRYEDLASRTRLTTPDSTLDQTFEWLKYNCDWLIQEVPEIGRGIVAGIPDYPWWFGVDSEYALQGYMAIGQQDIVLQTIHLLDRVSGVVNGNGRIIHEMSTNGAVFNPGNINETPQFATLVWNTYQWNGDREFLRKYFPTIRKGLVWLMEENDGNKNGFPDGFGMMEIHGLNSEMIDVATYTQAAFNHASLIARELGEEDLAAEYLQEAMRLRVKINEEFWSEEFGSYADFMGTNSQAIHLIEDAILRADTLDKPWAVEELERTRDAILKESGEEVLKPFVLHHNWVVNTPMETGIADPDKALRALETARKFTNPFGVFVTGIDRDQAAGEDEGSFEGSKVFSYTGAVMTLPTGVQAIAENNYGNPDQALDYLLRMTRSFSYAFPGSMYEVSPDYGMVVQAWNIYSFAVPIVRQFFGIKPMASKKEIWIRPQMPSSWQRCSLENVRVGDNRISIHYEQPEAGTIKLTVLQERGDWQILMHPGAEGASVTKIVRGNAEEAEKGGEKVLRCSGTEIEIIYSEK